MRFLNTLYLTPRFFSVLGLCVFLFVLGHFYILLAAIAKMLLFAFGLLSIVDALFLFQAKKGIFARRETPERFSNGDDNEVNIHIENFYMFPIAVKIIDELPAQFQIRDLAFNTAISNNGKKIINYTLKPVERGEYHFGTVNIYVSSPIKALSRRFKFSQNKMVPTYPSYIQLRKFQLFAVSNQLSDTGIKKIRKIGHTMEFDQVRKYVVGDDYRTINWKATARKSNFMVNQYQDEKSQQVYSIIDMGRVMRLPFEGMTLLDYAINSSLVISNIANQKEDKIGIITFSNEIQSVLPADRKHSQMYKVMELLYNQQTDYLESNFENLYAGVKRKITQRSLLLLYTNFETLSALKRQLQYLRRIASHHLLVTIFFENTELKQLLDQTPTSTEGIYRKTIAEKFAFEKKQIIKELERYGIHSILTPPQGLTVNTINKYLELKARAMI